MTDYQILKTSIAFIIKISYFYDPKVGKFNKTQKGIP